MFVNTYLVTSYYVKIYHLVIIQLMWCCYLPGKRVVIIIKPGGTSYFVYVILDESWHMWETKWNTD